LRQAGSDNRAIGQIDGQKMPKGGDGPVLFRITQTAEIQAD